MTDLRRVPTVDIAREWLRRYDSVNHRLRELDEMDGPSCSGCGCLVSDHEDADHCWACGQRGCSDG